jgi:hypothetical protein
MSRVIPLAAVGLILAGGPHLLAQEDTVGPVAPDSLTHGTALLPAAQPQKPGGGLAVFPLHFRSLDGTGNNTTHPDWGAAPSALLRLTAVDYGNGTDSPSGQHRAGAREISNACVAQPGSIPNAAGASDYLWQWGQFIDHDLDLVPGASPAEPFDISIPTGDPFFDPFSTGTVTMALSRSAYVTPGGVRQQINALTAYIDGSMVYGSDDTRAQELRTLDGTGRLKTSPGNLLPFNVNGFPNAPSPAPSFFLAGDVRANEQVGLTAMHTLWVREHNFWAEQIRAGQPWLTDDEIYLTARAIVGAEIQAITYREFLPILLGKKALPKYRGYDPGVNAGVSNVFATAAYRVGHTMLSSTLLRLDRQGNEVAAGHLSLADAFFRPDQISAEGIDSLLRGLAAQPAQEIDNFIVDPVRNFLFGPPGAGGFDLASLNIQRGRDHGLPSYNQVRTDFGLAPRASFADINPDPQVQAALAAVYATVDDVDIWVGGLAEPHVPGALVGEAFHAILKDQFLRARDGDRFWYESYMPPPIANLIERQTLSTIIKRNTGIGDELQANVLRVP